jgi:DNA-binding response OmpR family regulator
LAMNIYLIEDDLIYAEFIKKSLGLKPGYKITHFDSAEKALAALKSGIPDALIVDYKLPGMTGIELFDHAQRTRRWQYGAQFHSKRGARLCYQG